MARVGDDRAQWEMMREDEVKRMEREMCDVNCLNEKKRDETKRQRTPRYFDPHRLGRGQGNGWLAWSFFFLSVIGFLPSCLPSYLPLSTT